MQWRKFAIRLAMTGITRKKAAELLADSFGTQPQYSFADDQYTVSDALHRTWTVVPAPEVSAQKLSNDHLVGANQLYQVRLCSPLLYRQDVTVLDDVLRRMEQNGGVLHETTGLAVLLEVTGLEDRQKYADNLEHIYQSKGRLLQKALHREFSALADCAEWEERGLVSFPIFSGSFDYNEVLSCIQLAQAISQFAAERRSIRQKENTSSNEKFQLRTWLVRIGFVGAEFKFARKMLTESLDGNSAWLRKTEMTEEKQEEVQPEVVGEQDFTVQQKAAAAQDAVKFTEPDHGITM